MKNQQSPILKITPKEDMAYKKKVKGKEADYIPLVRNRTTLGKSSSLPSSFLPLSITQSTSEMPCFQALGGVLER